MEHLNLIREKLFIFENGEGVYLAETTDGLYRWAASKHLAGLTEEQAAAYLMFNVSPPQPLVLAEQALCLAYGSDSAARGFFLLLDPDIYMRYHPEPFTLYSIECVNRRVYAAAAYGVPVSELPSLLPEGERVWEIRKQGREYNPWFLRDGEPFRFREDLETLIVDSYPYREKCFYVREVWRDDTVSQALSDRIYYKD